MAGFKGNTLKAAETPRFEDSKKRMLSAMFEVQVIFEIVFFFRAFS
jgi:hypothetical protein